MKKTTVDNRFRRSLFVHCPYPDCLHTGEMITKAHCRTHGVEKEDLFRQYGEPQPVAIDGERQRNNKKMGRTIYPNNTPTFGRNLKTPAKKYR